VLLGVLDEVLEPEHAAVHAMTDCGATGHPLRADGEREARDEHRKTEKREVREECEHEGEHASEDRDTEPEEKPPRAHPVRPAVEPPARRRRCELVLHLRRLFELVLQ
jgi:hypothetical protein